MPFSNSYGGVSLECDRNCVCIRPDTFRHCRDIRLWRVKPVVAERLPGLAFQQRVKVSFEVIASPLIVPTKTRLRVLSGLLHDLPDWAQRSEREACPTRRCAV